MPDPALDFRILGSGFAFQAKRSAAKRSEAKRSEAKRSEAKRSEAKRSEAKRSEAKRSEAKRSEAKRSEAKRSEAKRSEKRSEARSEARRSEAKRSEARSRIPSEPIGPAGESQHAGESDPVGSDRIRWRIRCQVLVYIPSGGAHAFWIRRGSDRIRRRIDDFGENPNTKVTLISFLPNCIACSFFSGRNRRDRNRGAIRWFLRQVAACKRIGSGRIRSDPLADPMPSVGLYSIWWCDAFWIRRRSDRIRRRIRRLW